MRERILIAAAIVTSGWLGACSKPTNEQEAGASPESSRQIQLAEPARTDGAVVSDLEAGRVTEPVLVVSKRGTTTARAARRATPAPVQALVPETHVHTMSTTMTPVPEPVLRLASAPTAPVFGVARAADGSGQAAPENTTLPGMLPGITNRGTGIIIRGGLGRIDDDCDEHNIRGRTGGAAVNRLTPPIGGGNVRTSFRGGIR